MYKVRSNLILSLLTLVLRASLRTIFFWKESMCIRSVLMWSDISDMICLTSNRCKGPGYGAYQRSLTCVYFDFVFAQDDRCKAMVNNIVNGQVRSLAEVICTHWRPLT